MESSPSSSGRRLLRLQRVRVLPLVPRNPTTNPSVQDDIMINLLHAAYAGDIPQAKKLAKRLEKTGMSMEAAAAAGIVDPWNRCYGPLHYAAMAGEVEMCKFLIKDLKLDVDMTGSQGVTPLLLAIKYRGSAIARLLLLHDADPNKATTNGVTPLHTAAFQGSLHPCTLVF